MTPQTDHRPAPWLRELARQHPAPWPWGRSIRAAASIAGPLAIGLAVDQFLTALWIAMGTLISTGGEGAGTYRSRFRLMAISAPIGAAGYFCGHLAGLPFPATIAAMTAIAFLCGIVNSYGQPFSIGTMQFLLVASLALGLPQIAPFWQPAALFLVGVAIYALLLWVETLVDPRRPERAMLADLAAALGRLAAAQAAGPGEAAEAEAPRRAVTDRARTLYAALLETRRQGRSREALDHAEILAASDALFSALLIERNRAALAAAASWLAALAQAISRRSPAPPPPAGQPLSGQLLSGQLLSGQPLSSQPLSGALERLSAAAASGVLVPPAGDAAPPRRAFVPRLPRLAVGPVVLQQATALALCFGAALASHYVIDGNHWYWVPLTVALAMKPDFGSVFARAVLRAAGTTLGVAIGAGLLILLPKGYPLIAAMAVLALVLPWAKGLSYAAQAVALTPLVLILVDLILPMGETVDYGAQRLLDTVVGGAIVLVFGYFIWPRRHGAEIAARFAAALGALADYLETASAPDAPPAARWTAYARLSDLRATLGRAMTEPPPAGREAAAWFPAIAAAERICDLITAASADGTAAAAPPAETQAVAQALRRLSVDPPPTALTDRFLSSIAAEAAQLATLLEGAARIGDPTPQPAPDAGRGTPITT